MQLISLNVSQPKMVEHNGTSVLTGIFKQPCTGKKLVTSNNIEGDGQGDMVRHGGVHKAVYAFSYHHYDYWRHTLNNQNLTPGAFGENLTISCLDESDIFIGDRFRLGECLLEVSQPRMPCYKLGIALNNALAIKLFIDHYYTGVYFRVIEEGFIEQGDELIKVGQLAESVSVKTLFQAFMDKQYKNAHHVFSQALLIKELGPEWQKALASRV
ncbi:MOSC domain-containing protein [Marinomonas spartinae]|uniref:MOSC domain-containing protein n=1 Tax=Marinomonas spartinae TaxID=1792290 RepID=UPI0018F138DD|nr:MOSC domain-containing protein [Marinomonas spartinae]MBJ7555159.1 MOSC domain-containing protein [Marinomonas spartinae]